jgi:hypothetical protein
MRLYLIDDAGRRKALDSTPLALSSSTVRNDHGGYSMGYVISGFLLICMLAFCSSPETKSPCVYKHDFLTDFSANNTKKRTCQEMFDEGNSRIESLQTQLNARTNDIPRDADTLTVEKPSYQD